MKRRFLVRSPAGGVVFQLAAAALTLAVGCPVAHAQTFTWTPLTAGPFNWNNASSQNNWTSGFPNGVGQVALMTGNLSANQTVNLNTAITLGSLTLGDSSGTETTTLAPNGGSLTFDASSGSAGLIRTAGGTGTVTISTGITLNDDLAISLASGTASSTMNLSGVIGGSGRSITKNSSTLTLVLSGANTYTGTTIISAGRLLLAKQVSLYSNTPASWTAANIIVANTGSLGLNVGGTGEFTTSDVTTLLNNLGGANGTSTTGFAAGSGIAFDTTNAAGGTFTVADAIANSTGAGGGAIGVAKLGTGTLVLTNANTYSGTTTLGGGTLRLENTGALGASSTVSIAGNTLSIGTNTAVAQGAGTALSLAAGTIVSDRATPGAGLTHAFAGNMAVSNATHNFTGGSHVTDQNAGIQIGSITNASGSGGTATFNPTTANLTIVGGYTGVTNVGTNNLALGGSAANSSINGNIALGSRTTINVSKSGASVWTLSGANTGLAGTLNVTGGVLIATTLNALPNSGSATFNGGTIGARVGGAGWTTAELDNFLAAATTTKTSGALGIDTSNGDLTQWTAFTTTNLGSALGLTKLGTNKLTLNNAGNNYAGATLVSNGTLEMTVDHTLTGGLRFGYANGTTSTTGSLDLNNVNATFAGGLNVDGNSTTPYGIEIDSGKSLTVNGALQIGATTPGVSLTTTKLAMNGAGEFVFNGSTVDVGGSTSNSVTQDATLDLTGLAEATFTTTGNFRIAPNVGSVVASQATVLLPTPIVADTVATTTINVDAAASRGLSVGNGGSGGVGTTYKNTLQLGTGLTTINTPFINVGSNPVSGNQRDVGQLNYGQADIGDLIIRGADGTSRADQINLGVVNVGVFPQTTTASSPTVPVLFDTSGHDADILVTSLNMGAGLNRTAAQDHIFRFGAQTTGVGVGSLTSKLDVTNVNIGNRSAGNSNTATQTYKVDLSGGTVTFGNAGATGTGVDIGNNSYDQTGAATFNSELNISGGNVTIHNGSGGFAVRLGSASSATNGSTMNNSMNLTGGSTTLTGDIVRGTVAGGTVNSTLTLNGASAVLDMGGHDITGLTVITYSAGTLKNVGAVNTSLTLAGAGSRVFDQGVGISGTIQGAIAGSGVGLTKQGTGTLALTGANTYSGTTSITGGLLAVGAGGSINTTSGIVIDGGGLRYNNATTALTQPISFGAAGGSISGMGVIGTPLVFGGNAVLAPGNSPGTITGTAGVAWDPGGTYEWELNALSGAAGTNWDLLSVTAGGLDLGDLSPSNRFTLDLITLTGSNTAGPLAVGYVPGNSYEFLIASYHSLTVPGSFSTAANSDLTGLFTIDLAGWQGTQPALTDLSVKVNGDATGLVLIAVPEPGIAIVAVIGVATAGFMVRRRPRSVA